MVLPGFLDRYLAKVAFEGQETQRPVSPDREDNLQFLSIPCTARAPFGDEAEIMPWSQTARSRAWHPS